MNTYRTVCSPYGMLRLGLAIAAIYLLTGSGIAAADSASEAGPCSSGSAVKSPQDNPLLVQDCMALLEARDTLSQDGRRLIWTPDIPMSKWDGTSIEGSPPRVAVLSLPGNDENGRLKGRIPPVLGNLTGLLVLDLSRNGLSGSIPSNAMVFNLRELDLAQSQSFPIAGTAARECLTSLNSHKLTTGLSPPTAT